MLGALHNGGCRDNPLPAIVLSKLLYGLLVMQLVFLVKRRHTSVRHYIHRLSSKRPISFLINSHKDVDIHYVDFIPVVRNHLRALEKIQILMMVFEKIVSIYFFRYDLAVKIIEFRSFRFLKFLYCFQCLFVFPVCNILIRIYNYFFFMKNKWRIIRGCT